MYVCWLDYWRADWLTLVVVVLPLTVCSDHLGVCVCACTKECCGSLLGGVRMWSSALLDPRYKKRAQTFPEEYVRSNFSIKLNNISHDDAGEFICFITHTSYSKQEIVQLFINETTVETGKPSTEEENQSTRNTVRLSCSRFIFSVALRDAGFISVLIHDNKMKIIYLQFYVLMCFEAAVVDLLSYLGSNVTINCNLDENEVYWIFLKTPDPPTVILRTFPTPMSPHYYNKTFRNKYSVQFKHRLVINNVTADELGVYYCMNTRTPPKLSNSTRLHLNKSAQIIECHNHTVEEFIEWNNTVVNCIDQNQTKWQIISIISALMNGLLLIVLIRNRRSTEQSQQLNTDLQQTQFTEQHQDHLQKCESVLITKVNFCLDNY
ncbi:hypothetical protein QQF64_018905 [Cirrhinus molitorella]|uniref:Immunoglobulin domain-containing protein n=1 Tax=Cirrhinus molitorella TaxID=172907 RepID=A0ABR3LHC9_9TELE